MTEKRDTGGKFVKGQSGNPAGRPKKTQLSGNDAKEYVRLVKEGDLTGLMEFFASKVTDVGDLIRITEKFWNYKEAKKQSISSVTKEDKTLQITFKMEGLDQAQKEIVDVTPKTVHILDN